MKYFLFILPAFLLCLAGFGQQQAIAATAPELTEASLKKLFSTPQTPGIDPEWSSCWSSDSLYGKADTVRLCSDPWDYMTKHACFIKSWLFSKNGTLNIIDTQVCTEPPPSSISFGNSGLKVRFGKAGPGLTMSLYKNKVLKDKFILLSLRQTGTKSGSPVYELTMLRQRK